MADGPRFTGVATDQPTITGGTINNAVIGGTTAVAGTFSNLVATNFAMNGVAAASASTTVAALTLTTSLQSGFGWTTSAGHAAAVAALGSILTCLKDHGLMKS